MDNAAVFTWLLPNMQDQRRMLLQAQLDTSIEQYALALSFKARFDRWMRSFGVDDWGYVYPLEFIQAWGQTHGYTITSQGGDHGTARLTIDDSFVKIQTRFIPTTSPGDDGFWAYPTGATANPSVPEFAEQELVFTLKQLIADILKPMLREFRRIAFGAEFYNGIIAKRIMDERTSLWLGPTTTPWNIHDHIMNIVRDTEKWLGYLQSTGCGNEPARP